MGAQTGGLGSFELGNFELQGGRVLRDARLVYRTHGALAPDRSNVVLYPTSYGAHHTDIEWLIRPDGFLDPRRFFVVIPNMFGNGLSSSPSHAQGVPADFGVTHHDNVAAQDRLLREVFGIADLADYLVRSWEASYRRRDPADLLAMLDTWIACDVSATPRHGRDLAAALGSIRARVLVMPSATDLYFTPEDCAADAAAIPDAR